MIYNYEIKQTPSFEIELQNIYRYLCFTLQEPNTAEHFLKTVIDKIYSLQYFPERCSQVSNFRNRNLRKLYINNYLVIYEVKKEIRSSFHSTYFSLFSRLFP